MKIKFYNDIENYTSMEPDLSTFLFELEVGEKFEFKPFKHDNVIYAPSVYNANKGHCIVKKAEIKGEKENFFEDCVICPNCGYEFQDCYEFPDETDDYDCPECGATLSFQREVQISYSTQVVKKPRYKKY